MSVHVIIAPLLPSLQSWGDTCVLMAVQMALRTRVSVFHWALAQNTAPDNKTNNKIFFMLIVMMQISMAVAARTIPRLPDIFRWQEYLYRGWVIDKLVYKRKQGSAGSNRVKSAFDIVVKAGWAIQYRL